MTKREPELFKMFLAGGLVLMAILACSFGQDGGEVAGENPTHEVLDLVVTGTSTTTVGGDAAPTGEATVAPPTDPPDELACPDGPASYMLVADYYFWTDTGMGDWVWQAAGTVQVVLGETGEVINNAAQTMGSGSQSGQFSADGNTCSFEAPAEVVSTVAGHCRDGVLELQIMDEWVSGTFQWTCDDDSFQFDLPTSMLPASHSVTLPLEPNAQAEASFAGFGGGAKTWTLVME